MRREDLADLSAFVAVAEERSFTRAAAKLGTSQSALSYTVRRLEARLGVRLLARTTRAVAPTEAGERLLRTLRPAFEMIDGGIADLGAVRDRPAGTIRITANDLAVRSVLRPMLASFLDRWPEITVELDVSSELRDIVAERFDAGVRLGEQVDADMIAVRIGPDLRMAAVAASDYLARHPRPVTPDDLVDHRCLNIRLPTAGGIYAWEFGKDGRELRVRVEGPLVLNRADVIAEAAADGLGIAYLPEDYVASRIATGQLVRLLEDWCPPFPGLHLYYPSRRQPTAAFALLVDALRWRE